MVTEIDGSPEDIPVRLRFPNGSVTRSQSNELDVSFSYFLDGYIYFGDPNTDGTWRFYSNGTDLLVERRESSSWIEKSAFLA